MGEALLEKLNRSFRGRILKNEHLSRHTTWRVGGAADLLLIPADREDLQSALAFLEEAGVRWFTLGAGSNLLVRDGGFRGAAIHLGGLRKLSFLPGDEVVAEGGLPLMTLIRETAKRGLGGLEGLGGIPGTVGGGIAMNAGAGGQDLSGVVVEATVVSPAGEETWEKERLSFGYRRSAVGGARIVAEARLKFRPGDPETLEGEIRRRLLHRRACHGVGGPNAGSVFKNPPGEAAWRLIENAGLRGARIGGAQVSEKHCNFIVNVGGARAADILALIERVRSEVLRQTGIELEPEVRIIGEDGSVDDYQGT